MKNFSDGSSLGGKIYAGCLYTCLVVYTAVFLFGRCLLPPQEQWCPYTTTQAIPYSNPDYNYHPCYKYRTPHLLYLHLQEIEFAQRMIFSLILGGIIGFERRASERPAGIRTMGMVCLGSCFFSMTSQLAFKSSTMGWDAARVAAAVPSGVGFLGAGLIWKGSTSSTREVNGQLVTTSSQEVHGLTTAASVWLAAAVGVAVGGGRRLYIVSVYGVALVILVLRFGPQMYFAKDSESVEEWDDFDDELLDWENFTEDSSEVLSQYEDTNNCPSDKSHDINNMMHRDSDEHETTRNREMEPLLKLDSTALKSSSKPLSRHASAPNILAMTYETPIVDHDAKPDRENNRRKKKRVPNVLKISFRG